MMKIIITDPLGNQQKFALSHSPGMQWVLGRAEDCDVVLANDANVSRRHAVLECRDSGWYICDNQSANGVLLGETPILAAPLREGRQFRIGHTVLEVVAAAPAAEPLPAAVAEPPAPAESDPAEEVVAVSYDIPASAEAPAPPPAPAEEAEEAVAEEAVIAVGYTELPPAAALPEPPPLQVVPLPQRGAVKRLPQGKKPQPRAFRQAGGAKAAPQKEKPATRAVRRAGGAAAGQKTAPARKLRALEEVAAPVGVPATELGLPYDFELQFFLAEPRHAVTDGSVLRFGLAAATDCSIFLVQHDCMGHVCLLVPGRADGRALLSAGHVTALPPKGLLADDELVAGAPYGTDTVVAVACSAAACPFGTLLAAALAPPAADAPAVDGTPGALERQVLEQCRTAMADTPAHWSCSVLRVQTFPSHP